MKGSYIYGPRDTKLYFIIKEACENNGVAQEYIEL